MGDLKTPWNPSKKAVKRVKNPLPAPTECIHCGNKVCIVKNDEIYGKCYGEWPWAFRCDNCAAYVGLHPYTNIPLGTLATEAIRKARQECKAPFESLWRTGRMTRNEAYEKLAKKLNIPKDECHFGWFNLDQCRSAASAAREIFLGVA